MNPRIRLTSAKVKDGVEVEAELGNNLKCVQILFRLGVGGGGWVGVGR